MNWLKTVSWITWYTAVAGAVFGAIYGMSVLALLTLGRDHNSLQGAFRLGALYGAVLGGGVGIPLGLIVGRSVAEFVYRSGLPLTEAAGANLYKHGVSASLAGVALILFLVVFWLYIQNLLAGMLFLFIPALIAFSVACWVVRHYVNRNIGDVQI